VLVESSLADRETAIGVIHRLYEEGKADGTNPSSGQDLDLLNRGLAYHLESRDELYQVANAQSCWLKPSRHIYAKLGMQPISPEHRLKGVMLSLSSALLLYDNYLMMTSLYLENGKLRRFLNQRDSAYEKGKNELDRLAIAYNSPSNRAVVRHAIKTYEKQAKQLAEVIQRDKDFAYLDTLIHQSQSYNMLKQSAELAFIGRHLLFMSTVTNDDLLELRDHGVNLFSSLFGMPWA